MTDLTLRAMAQKICEEEKRPHECARVHQQLRWVSVKYRSLLRIETPVGRTAPMKIRADMAATLRKLLVYIDLGLSIHDAENVLLPQWELIVPLARVILGPMRSTIGDTAKPKPPMSPPPPSPSRSRA